VSEPSLDVVGIGSMVVDHLYRSPRILRGEEKGILRPHDSGESARSFVGGVVLNHLGWAASLGLRTGIFGKQADDAAGRFLRGAMDRLGIQRHLVLDGRSSSTAEIFVDDEGGRAIYMAPGATAETDAEHVRVHHAAFLRRSARLTTEVSQLPLSAVLEALRLAREAGIPTLVDLDVPPSDAVPGLGGADELEAVLAAADLLKPAKAAARELCPEHADETIRRRSRGRCVSVTTPPS
jgi:ribokinase